MEEAVLKQILLITDGCSNTGVSPVEAAESAVELGVTINVIGVGNPDVNPHAAREIESIAEAGNGLYEIVTPRQLSQTVQMVTRQAMTRTINRVVQKELQQLLGTSTLSELPPDSRMEVVKKAEDIGENCTLQILLLIDTSASMKSKIKAVEQAIYEFDISLRSRAGNSLICVATFPGKLTYLEEKIDWTEDISHLKLLPRKILMSGVTPTGPALMESLQKFDHRDNRSLIRGSRNTLREGAKTKTSGLLKDHVF
ncbi:MAG: hypothetical protein H0Z33_12495 [Bacillaceae bacterium]|nr:hypothetical protein [Bacillaceae bacterium]